MSTFGWSPRASSRSSSSARVSSSRERARISVAASTSVSIRDSASRSESDSGRQSLLRAVVEVSLEPTACGIGRVDDPARDARSSSSWRLRSLTSAPEISTRATPDWSRIGVAVQATVSSRPSPVIQRDSRSA